MYRINPTLNIKIRHNYEFDELLYNKLYQLNDITILRLLSILKKHFTYEEVISNIISIFNCTKNESENIFEVLFKKNIIVRNVEKNDDHTAKLEWLERNWSPSLLHYVTSRNIEFQDIGSNNDKKIASKYYKELSKKEKSPSFYKKYIDSPFIPLPRMKFTTERDTYKILLNRKTHRNFNNTPLNINEFSEILYMATQDVRNVRESMIKLINKHPELYTNSVFTCNEIYLYINNVCNISPGLYHYDIQKHGLNFLNNLPKKPVGYYCYGQPEIKNANCVIFISANYHKYMWRYNHERAYRNILIDVAQLAQSIILTATNLKKKTFLTPALRDSELVQIFGLEEYVEDIRYLVAIGN